MSRARDLVDGDVRCRAGQHRADARLLGLRRRCDPTPAEAAQNQVMHGVDSAGEALAAHAFGGVFLRPEVIADADQVDRLAGVLHDVGDRPDGLPLLVSIDQEGGVVQRLKVGVDVVPSARLGRGGRRPGVRDEGGPGERPDAAPARA